MQISGTYIYSFIAWITVLTDCYTDSIIAGMVKKGYLVSAVAAKGNVVLSKDNDAAAVITLKIGTTDETKKAVNIHDDLLLVVNGLKAYYYSAVVTAYVDCSWNGTNISILPQKDPIFEVKEIKSKLN